MSRVAKLPILAGLLSLCLSSPIVTTSIANADSSLLSPRAEWKSNELNNEFKGIWWNHLLEDEDDGCTPEQIDKIVYATRYALKMTELPRLDGQFEYSAAWDRYFTPYKSWLRGTAGDRSISADIMCQYGTPNVDLADPFALVNMMQASRYPKEGSTKEASQIRRAHFTCNPRNHGKAPEVCAAGGKTAAATVHPLGNEWNRWIIVFCPFFFNTDKLGYLEEKTNGKRTTELGVAWLMTYEHAIAHEFMHVGMFGYRNAIEDLEVQLEEHHPWLQVYGDSRCHQLAIREVRSTVEWLTASNADNYAWFFPYYWFDKHWDWSKRKHDELKKGEPVNPAEPEDSQFETPEIDFPVRSFPVNADKVQIDTSENPACRTLPANAKSNGNPIVVCEYVGEEYSVWRDELSKPFKSSGGCELSPACHQTGDDLILAHKDCTCKCDNKNTNLADERYSGFAGVTLDGLVAPSPAPEDSKPAPAPEPAPEPAPAPAPKPKCAWWDFICWLSNL